MGSVAHILVGNFPQETNRRRKLRHYNLLIEFFSQGTAGTTTNVKFSPLKYKLESKFNEPLYNEVFGITNDFPDPSNSKMYGKDRLP